MDAADGPVTITLREDAGTILVGKVPFVRRVALVQERSHQHRRMSVGRSAPSPAGSAAADPGPSGREGAVADVVIEQLPDGVEVERDGIGSLMMRVPGRTSAHPRLAIIGHMDEVGLMVTGIDDDGNLAFGAVGGLMPETLVAQRVKILTASGDVPGVIGTEPNWYPGRDSHADAGHDPRDAHRHRGGRPGRGRDAGADRRRGGDRRGAHRVGPRPVHLTRVRRPLRRRTWRPRSCDGVAERGGAPTDVVGVGSVQEETAFGGAHTTPGIVEPDLAVVVDVDYPRAAPREDGWTKDGLGAGAVIVRGTILNDDLTLRLIKLAVDEGIPHVVRAYPGDTATDADVVALSRRGIPTAVVSISLRHMHSPVEVAQVDDIEACVRLLVAFAETLA